MTDRIETAALQALAECLNTDFNVKNAKLILRVEPDAGGCITLESRISAKKWHELKALVEGEVNLQSLAAELLEHREAATRAERAGAALALECAEMPYRIFTDSSRVWLDDDDGGSLFAYVREGSAVVAPAPAETADCTELPERGLAEEREGRDHER